jgi:methyltransferase family protein
MLQMISGFWLSRALYAAAKLGLADLLKDGSRTVDDLAQLSGTDASSLYRVLSGRGREISVSGRRARNWICYGGT